jgi:hypothetical protein
MVVVVSPGMLADSTVMIKEASSLLGLVRIDENVLEHGEVPTGAGTTTPSVPPSVGKARVKVSSSTSSEAAENENVTAVAAPAVETANTSSVDATETEATSEETMMEVAGIFAAEAIPKEKVRVARFAACGTTGVLRPAPAASTTVVAASAEICKSWPLSWPTSTVMAAEAPPWSLSLVAAVYVPAGVVTDADAAPFVPQSPGIVATIVSPPTMGTFAVKPKVTEDAMPAMGIAKVRLVLVSEVGVTDVEVSIGVGNRLAAASSLSATVLVFRFAGCPTAGVLRPDPCATTIVVVTPAAIPAVSSATTSEAESKSWFRSVAPKVLVAGESAIGGGSTNPLTPRSPGRLRMRPSPGIIGSVALKEKVSAVALPATLEDKASVLDTMEV